MGKEYKIFTADMLIEEAKANCVVGADEKSLEEMVAELPAALHEILETGMYGIHYPYIVKTDVGVMFRGLALAIVNLDRRLAALSA